MGAAYFYHLTRNPLEQSLVQLLTRARDAGMRSIVRGPDRARLAWLDERLWLGPPDAFLAHGLSGGAHDAHQPILLTDQAHNPNAAQCLMAIDGTEVDPQDVTSLDRVCILFDGHDDAAVQTARQQWKHLTDAGVPATYWSEDSGRWEKKSEKNTSPSP